MEDERQNGVYKKETLSDFMSSAKCADVKRAAVDRSEWRLMNGTCYKTCYIADCQRRVHINFL